MSHAASIPGEGKLYATITTSLGTMTALLHEDLVPKTVDNFVGLATGRIEYTDPRTGQPGSGPYYDGTIFHRVIPQFMVQAGDPTGTGRGGPGYRFEDEFHPELRHDRPGILSMANAGPNTNGSQFFVTEVPTPHLDNRHSVFGVLVDGVELVSKITGVPKGPGDKPQTDVVLQSITFFRKAD